MRQILTILFMTGLALAFLVHFCLIALLGDILIQEPNRLILIAEIATMVAIAWFGVANFIKVIKES